MSLTENPPEEYKIAVAHREVVHPFYGGWFNVGLRIPQNQHPEPALFRSVLDSRLCLFPDRKHLLVSIEKNRIVYATGADEMRENCPPALFPKIWEDIGSGDPQITPLILLMTLNNLSEAEVERVSFKVIVAGDEYQSSGTDGDEVGFKKLGPCNAYPARWKRETDQHELVGIVLPNQQRIINSLLFMVDMSDAQAKPQTSI